MLTLVQQGTNRHCLSCCPVEIFTFSEFLKSSVNVCLLQSWVNILLKNIHTSYCCQYQC